MVDGSSCNRSQSVAKERYGCNVNERVGFGRSVRPDNRTDSERTTSPQPQSSSRELGSERESTLDALKASTKCERIIISGPTRVWMLSSPAQLAALKSALKR